MDLSGAGASAPRCAFQLPVYRIKVVANGKHPLCQNEVVKLDGKML